MTIGYVQIMSYSNNSGVKLFVHVKKQGYMTNAQLRKYVKYVDKQKSRLSWASMVT